jgi:acyl carrier protein phosphodiesterase
VNHSNQTPLFPSPQHILPKNSLALPMNFLGHLYLSGYSEDILLGNFIGDFVKGNAYENYPDRIREGILLHRKIDFFTDTHEEVSRSKEVLREKYRHYSGVIVDMFYDHFLATSWPQFHPDPLPVFASNVYKILLGRKDDMPEKAAYMLNFMSEHNWLLSYASPKGIHQALSGMARRTSFVSHMEKAVKDLEDHYDIFQAHFHAFFPDIIQEVAKENPFFTPPPR